MKNDIESKLLEPIKKKRRYRYDLRTLKKLGAGQETLDRDLSSLNGLGAEYIIYGSEWDDLSKIIDMWWNPGILVRVS